MAEDETLTAAVSLISTARRLQIAYIRGMQSCRGCLQGLIVGESAHNERQAYDQNSS